MTPHMILSAYFVKSPLIGIGHMVYSFLLSDIQVHIFGSVSVLIISPRAGKATGFVFNLLFTRRYNLGRSRRRNGLRRKFYYLPVWPIPRYSFVLLVGGESWISGELSPRQDVLKTLWNTNNDGAIHSLCLATAMSLLGYFLCLAAACIPISLGREHVGNPGDHNSTYYNPILPGFHPDPSCIFVPEHDDTFFCASSSFNAFPGIPIHASKDLQNWRLVGHVLNRREQLPRLAETNRSTR